MDSYHYFDARPAVIEALTERLVHDSERALAPIVEDRTLGATEKLQVFFGEIIRWKSERQIKEMVATHGAHTEAIERHLGVPAGALDRADARVINSTPVKRLLGRIMGLGFRREHIRIGDQRGS